MLEFYRGLGMVESDRVLEKAERELAAVFLRSDPEHHSFAAFRAPQSRADHHCYETNGWLDIRDWADRMASLRIPLWWGPGRHGPGNNLFFMIEDPDGHKVGVLRRARADAARHAAPHLAARAAHAQPLGLGLDAVVRDALIRAALPSAVFSGYRNSAG